MTTAPLTRDQQIELMKTAKDRHDATVARWMQDNTVRELLREPCEKQASAQHYRRRDVLIARCA